MRNAKSKKVGAGGRFDIFLDSEEKRNMSDFLTIFLANLTILGPPPAHPCCLGPF